MRPGCSVALLLGLLVLVWVDHGLSEVVKTAREEVKESDTDPSTEGLSVSTDRVRYEEAEKKVKEDSTVAKSSDDSVRNEEIGEKVEEELPTDGVSVTTDSVNQKESPHKNSAASGSSNPGDCNEYCSLSYPPHTYPHPLHYKSCTSGCRSAQLDALIVWPAKPDGNTCVRGCQEAYSDDKQRYACQTGCKAPTWDTMFPDRGHLYRHSNLPVALQEDSEVGSIIAQMMGALMSQADFFSPREFDQLQDHAVEMEMVIVPLRQFDITILGDEDVYKVHQYNMDSKDGSQQKSSSSESSWLTYHESHEECLWFRHRLIMSRFLLFLSFVLAILGALMCCSSFSSSKKAENKKLKNNKNGSFVCCMVKMTPDIPQKVQMVQPYEKVPVLSKKAPYDLSTEFLIPVPTDTKKNVKHSVL